MYELNEMLHLKKHDKITNPGDYIVLKGYMACKTAKQLVYFAKQGDTILVMDNFCGEMLEFEAKTEVLLVKMPKEEPFMLARRKDDLQLKLIEALIERVQFFSIPAKERMYVLLYQVGKEIGIQAGDDCYIPSVMTQREMGAYISCTREYLCVMRKNLIEEGWLGEGRGWKLLNWERWNQQWGEVITESVPVQITQL
ncbi:Crp/Fnr family transcriptional regulator [Listeria booriae]|uniref:Crp/Fnr family transcriptional regulator n=1 Tax=Listeria booriae TaxID=1552123 RepID=UPI0016256D83|nr:Crp/Fnr family transcriptional regulator [Listeria booriae]MBC1228131.1 Crp/Fnr family transcriptional regulator [Listeria booriae]